MPASIVVSPPGELMWPKILKPAPLEKAKPGRIPKTGWSVDLLLAENDDATRELIREIQDFFWLKHGQGKRPGQNGKPYKPFLDPDDQPTGLMVFRFKTNQFLQQVNPATGEIERQELSPPEVQDARGNPWPRDLLIGNGSVGRVAFNMYGWNNEEAGLGVSLDLRGVRVLEHVRYEGASARDAFGDPEEGYTLANGSVFNQPPASSAPAQEPEDDEEVPF